ncbi:class I SAM-dependent methyltransferase [Haloechinothrix sp. YIM 98757]|uniref:Class I SAM-dependent methyltransferase n=1 Tax=Haloechinothrix aidingensis TaxID=2752311 RepID=A0A838AG14_9PSEU|nr:class I SAM-dependent methyltransferase [Haloechinothrix aidingensis]
MADSAPDETPRFTRAEQALGVVGPARRTVTAQEAVAASSAWWDADAEEYVATHGDFLGDADFVWCPEGWRESDLQLLGPVTGLRVLEVGCGTAACARWLTGQGALAVGVDLSAEMLRHARAADRRSDLPVDLVRADAQRLPLRSGSVDTAFSAFGALPFLPSLATVFTEVNRVLRDGGRWVFAVTHPMRWVFPDDPGPLGLTATHSYFDREPYVEVDAQHNATYVEYHRTLGDYVRAARQSGFRLDDLVEPEWPDDQTRIWGQWSPLRGTLFPGTAIFCCHKTDAPNTGPARPATAS